MKRRELILGLIGSLAAPIATLAQARQMRIGVLSPVQRPRALPAILKRLAELGFVEGKNLTVELRSTDGVKERFASLARELLGAKCDLIIAYGTEHAAWALIESKANVPIVILALDYDPVREGVVSSLRRPGKNVTGMYVPQPELMAKRLELLLEVLPRATRILVLADPYTTAQLDAARDAAGRLRVELVVLTFAALPYDFDSAFEKGRRAGVEALLLPTSPVFFEHRAKIAELALASRLPSMVTNIEWLRAGFLVSYGLDSGRAFARAGDIAARILKGGHPGEIPVEQSNVYEVALNLKTAKALGITIPRLVLLRAEEIIE